MRGWTLMAFLMLGALLGPSVAARGDDGQWSLEDRLADQELAYPSFVPPGGPTGNPFSAYTRHLDVTKVTMGEDETGVGIDLEVDELVVGAPSQWATEASCWNGRPPNGRETILIDFKLADVPFQVEIWLRGDWNAGGGLQFQVAQALGCLCPFLEGINEMSFCPKQRLGISLDDARDRIHVWIPKSSLLGQNAVPASFGVAVSAERFKFPRAVHAGDVLSELRVRTYSQPLGTYNFLSSFSPYVSDEAPDEGAAPGYVLHAATANQVLRLQIEQGGPYLPVRPEANQSVLFTVDNRADGRRIVSFEYRLVGRDEVLPHYAVHGPARATMPPQERRSLHAYVAVGPGARSEDNVTLQVRAVTAGYQEVGFAETILAAGTHVGPGSDTLYAHTRRLGSSCFGLQGSGCYGMFLSALRDDPQAADDQRAPQGWWTTELDPQTWRARGQIETLGLGTSAPVAFESKGRVQLQLSFDLAEPVGPVEVTAVLSTSNQSVRDRTLALFSGEADLDDRRATITLEAPLRAEVTTLPRGSGFKLQYEVVATLSPGTVVSATGSSVRPRDTWIRLPVVELPPELQNRAVASPFQVAVLDAREEFVNPGEARAFNVTILNQDVVAHTARVEASVDVEGWRVEVRPGSTFRLEPGDLIRIRLVAHAGPEAVEGDRATVRFNVTDEMGRSVADTVRLVTATQVDLPDASQDFSADAEAAQALVRPPSKDTPAPQGLLGALAVLGALVAARRRRA